MRLPKTDFYITEPHYADHLIPIEEELNRRGVPARIVTHAEALADEQGPIVVAAYGDLCRVRSRNTGRPLVLMEHGAGQTYSGAGRGAYADGEDLAGVSLCLVPGPYAAVQRARNVGHRTRVVKVGLTKLFDLLASRREFIRHAKAPGRKRVVAFGWHWDCRVCPETRATWPRWISAVQGLTRADAWSVLGHGHPREWPLLEQEYAARKIRAERCFYKVMEVADVYVVDNSSTAFEALACGVPVLLLDSPGWDASNHGLRFGLETRQIDRCGDPRQLRGALEHILSDVQAALERQQPVLRSVYEPRIAGPTIAADEIELLARGVRGPIC